MIRRHKHTGKYTEFQYCSAILDNETGAVFILLNMCNNPQNFKVGASHWLSESMFQDFSHVEGTSVNVLQQGDIVVFFRAQVPQQTIVQMENVACGCWQQTSAALQSLPLEKSVFNTQKITQPTGRKKENQPKQPACMHSQVWISAFAKLVGKTCHLSVIRKMMPVTRDKFLKSADSCRWLDLNFMIPLSNLSATCSFLKSRGSFFGTTSILK